MSTTIKQFEPVTVCAECGDMTKEVFSGDEGWTICEGCGTVEGYTKTMYACPDCEELCDKEECDCDLPTKELLHKPLNS